MKFVVKSTLIYIFRFLQALRYTEKITVAKYLYQNARPLNFKPIAHLNSNLLFEEELSGKYCFFIITF